LGSLPYQEGILDTYVVSEHMDHAEFTRLFPDDESCHAYLKERLYPDGTTCPGCQRQSKFHPIRGRAAYSCQFCGTQVYPTAGTIFHKSRTSLRLWFWAIFLVASTRGRITARQLERELRVTYKTAHRMLVLIQSQIGQEWVRAAGATDKEESVRDAGPAEKEDSLPAAGPAEGAPAGANAPEPAAPLRPRAWHAARRRA
jgi:hypothetical protein